MANRISTNLEQSKHLLSLGLDPKSADMVWMCNKWLYSIKDNILNQEQFSERDTLAWSLSALLEVMPSTIGDYDLYITKHKYVDGGHGYNVEYNRGYTISVLHKGTSRDLVTAAYEMVCWLLENNLIKKGSDDGKSN